MATPNCDLCEQAPADLIIGLVATGDQAFVCTGCLPAFVGALIQPAPSEAPDVPTWGPEQERQLAESGGPFGNPTVEATGGPDSPQEAPGDAWEADYPQPAQEAPRGRKRGQNGKAEAATETAPAAADHE